MATTSNDIQDLIDAKRAEIADLIVKIMDLNTTILTITTTPKPSYRIDGQEVDYNNYLMSLTRGVNDLSMAQDRAIDDLGKLITLQMRLEPYHYVSRNI